MFAKPVTAAVVAASIALAAPAAFAEGDACFVSAITGKVSNLFADAKAFLGFGEAAEDQPCGMVEFAQLLNDPAIKEKLQELVHAKVGSADKADTVEEAPAASCCTAGSGAEAAAPAEADARLDALAKVFGSAVTKNAADAKSEIAHGDAATCAAEAESCPLEAATAVTSKVEGEKAEVDAASLPACCAKKLETAD